MTRTPCAGCGVNAAQRGTSVAFEYAVRCPDGAVWDYEPDSRQQAVDMAVDGDSMCGCEQSGHLAVERPIAPWRPLAPSAADRSAAGGPS